MCPAMPANRGAQAYLLAARIANTNLFYSRGFSEILTPARHRDNRPSVLWCQDGVYHYTIITICMCKARLNKKQY
jgi:hypothetical protein